MRLHLLNYYILQVAKKIITTKTNLVVTTSILTFALIATVTLAFAQGEDTGMTTDNSTMMNATLAFAQGEDTGMTTDNSTMMNATLALHKEKIQV